MKFIRKRGLPLLATLLLMMGLVVIAYVDLRYENQKADQSLSDLISFEVEAPSGQTELVHCWYSKSRDKYFVYLPSYCQMSDVTVKQTSMSTVYLGDSKIQTGDSCQQYETGQTYTLLSKGLTEKKVSLEFVHSGGVATMYIDTLSGSKEYIEADRSNEESAETRIYLADGELDYSGSIKSIKCRGNSSYTTTDKKSYNIKLENRADLLGMGSEKKWCLISNYNDVANMNNKLVYQFAEDIGLAYSPACQYVDLYLNGTYNGLYLLCEKNNIGENRIDISEPTQKTSTSFVVSRELEDRLKARNRTFVSTKKKNYFRIQEPSEVTDEQKTEIHDTMQSIENAIVSQDHIDEDTGKSLFDMIDLDSWVKKYILEEIFESIDAMQCSQFFYRDNTTIDDKIYAGPVWDFNSAFGNPRGDIGIKNPRVLMANRFYLARENHENWFYYLYYQNDTFYERVKEIYQEEVQPVLEKLASQDITELSDEIAGANEMNYVRWFAADSKAKTIEETRDRMIDFASQRLEYLNEVWIEGKDYCQITYRTQKSARYAYVSVLRGDYLTEDMLPDYQIGQTRASAKEEGVTLEFTGWYDVKTKEAYDFSKPVTENLSLYANWVEQE